MSTRNPADEARRQTLIVLVGLMLLVPRLVRIYRAAGQARQLERELRHRHARELNDLDDNHLARVAELGAELRAAREQLQAAGQAIPPGAPVTEPPAAA